VGAKYNAEGTVKKILINLGSKIVKYLDISIV